MKITILTLFPELFEDFFATSIIGRAVKKGLLQYELINIRDFGEGVHQVVDGKPFGGGPGMVFKADILAKAWKSVADKNPQAKLHTIMTSAGGKTFNQQKAGELSKMDNVVVVCGHYEGVDERFIDKYVDEEISIGDYVLTGGELPAMVMIDAAVRLIPGVLNKEESIVEESFSENLLEYPQYTRPEKFENQKVPAVLLSGHHENVKKWRQEKALAKTKKIRPDLLKRVSLS